MGGACASPLSRRSDGPSGDRGPILAVTDDSSTCHDQPPVACSLRLPRDSPLSLVIVNELVQRSGGGAPPVIRGAGSFGSGGPSVAMRRYLSHNQRHNAKVHAENAIGWRWAAIRLMRQTRRRRAIKKSARASAGDRHPCKASGMPISTPPFPRVRSDDLMASHRDDRHGARRGQGANPANIHICDPGCDRRVNLSV